MPQENEMTEVPWWRRSLPLYDQRDVWARIGFRCVWCTIPYFAFALLSAAAGHEGFLLGPWAAVPLIVPVAGGIVDWLRVKTTGKQAPAL